MSTRHTRTIGRHLVTSKGSSIKKLFGKGKFIWIALVDGLVMVTILSLGVLIAMHVALGWGWVPMIIAVCVALCVHEAIEYWEEQRNVKMLPSEPDDNPSATTQAPHTPDTV